jgi:hypothetical protein
VYGKIRAVHATEITARTPHGANDDGRMIPFAIETVAHGQYTGRTKLRTEPAAFAALGVNLNVATRFFVDWLTLCFWHDRFSAFYLK